MASVTLNIPNKWSDITIGTYQKYVKIQESKKSDKNKVFESLALLCNIDKVIVGKMDYSDLQDIMAIIKNLIDTEPNKSEFKKVFMFNSVKYGMIPNLSKITTGEYIDLESFCKDNPIENLHIIMSVLYRPIEFERGDRYKIESYDPELFKEQVFKECPMNIALGGLGFFLTLGERLAHSSLSYLNQVETTQQKA